MTHTHTRARTHTHAHTHTHTEREKGGGRGGGREGGATEEHPVGSTCRLRVDAIVSRMTASFVSMLHTYSPAVHSSVTDQKLSNDDVINNEESIHQSNR